MKKALRTLLVLALVLGVQSCAYKFESVKGDPTGTRIYTLDNGLKVYMIVNDDQPRIDAQVAVKVGSKNDPRETTGLAHYFEHLMFKGTEQFGTQDYEAEKPLLDQIEALFETYRQTTDPLERKAVYHTIDSISYEASKLSIPNEYDKLMASIGARGTNAYTGTDVTCYVENIPSNQLELWARIQADRFRNCVLRGFHTELETIYEEFNMYNAMDQTRAINALLAGLFEKHPYNTDVIGLPSHLKNPSITNVKNYHDEWYVPNNMAVILSGDFDPDNAIRIVDKYFGQLEPNENLKKMEFEPESPITSHKTIDIPGNESPFLLLGWRFPGANSDQTVLLEAFSKVLYNGTAGLVDLDVNQQQKTLGMYSTLEGMSDYSIFLVVGEPKPGQTLDEVRDIALAEIGKIKAGDFDESVMTSVINNMKLDFMQAMESTGYMASLAVDSFIDDIPWADVVGEVDALSKITKEDIVRFANDNFKDNYVQVNKTQGTPEDDGSKIDKPAITPIFTNRDTASAFLREVQALAAAVSPIDPVFVDFERDMSRLTAENGSEILYKQNVTNGTFQLDYMFETGSNANLALPFACDYAQYLGTSDMTAQEVQKYLYGLACTFQIQCSGTRTYVSMNGLAENMEKVMEFAEKFIKDVQPDSQALAMLKENTLQSRANDKTSQDVNDSRLFDYCLYGPRNASTNILSESQINALTDKELTEMIRDLFSIEHKTVYYGPMGEREFTQILDRIHRCPQNQRPADKGELYQYAQTDSNTVIIAPFDANQSILYSISCTGEQYDSDKIPIVVMYNEYFGGGMNSIVFQEMREARGLAYSAYAGYRTPQDLDHPCYYMNFIQTQNDKIVDALTAFDDIINNMPQSQNAFDIAKENILTTLRTQRIVKSNVLWSYINARKLGLDREINQIIYEKVPDLTLQDVIDFQQGMVKDRDYTICILGRESDFDLEAISRFGTITRVTTEDIFGY
ncbi:MAG: insulinase family protein [Bacteroidales bacterium]|nr:insulinase family protein [Bacteroidales bacterium]